MKTPMQVPKQSFGSINNVPNISLAEGNIRFRNFAVFHTGELCRQINFGVEHIYVCKMLYYHADFNCWMQPSYFICSFNQKQPDF